MLLNYGHSVIVSTYNYLTYCWLMKKILEEKLKKNTHIKKRCTQGEYGTHGEIKIQSKKEILSNMMIV